MVRRTGRIYRGQVSNVEQQPGEIQCPGSAVVAEPKYEVLAPREVPLGGPRAMVVRRSLPNKDRRMVGAWCFVDFYGPADITGLDGMQFAPHPHIGLQTVSWLLSGEVLHRDSLGSRQLIRPGMLNLMTAGHGIAHSEESPAEHSATLHGIQLWVALPDAHRSMPPDFAHHADLPILFDAAGTITVILGELGDEVSPARTYTPIVGAEIALTGNGVLPVPLAPDFEHAVLALNPGVTVDGHSVEPGSLLYLGCGRREIRLGGDGPAKALLLGGVPFAENLVMWWNFVGRGHDEIVAARSDWEAGREAADPGSRFGVVRGYHAPPLPAPRLPNGELRPRARARDVETG